MKQLSKNAQIGEDGGLEARRTLGLGEAHPLDDILRALERTTPLKVFVRPLGQDGIAGAFWNVRDVPFILINATHAAQRQRFSLAHELGHYRLDHGNTYDIKVSWTDTNPKEIQANYFAASFLMPSPAVGEALSRLGHPDVSFDVMIELATTFGVSAKAMRLRLETLGHLRGRRISEFDQLIDAEAHHGLPQAKGLVPVSDTLAAARNVGHVPPQMAAKAFQGVERKLLRPEQVADLLRLDPERVESLRETFLVVAE